MSKYFQLTKVLTRLMGTHIVEIDKFSTSGKLFLLNYRKTNQRKISWRTTRSTWLLTVNQRMIQANYRIFMPCNQNHHKLFNKIYFENACNNYYQGYASLHFWLEWSEQNECITIDENIFFVVFSSVAENSYFSQNSDMILDFIDTGPLFFPNIFTWPFFSIKTWVFQQMGLRVVFNRNVLTFSCLAKFLLSFVFCFC